MPLSLPPVLHGNRCAIVLIVQAAAFALALGGVPCAACAQADQPDDSTAPASPLAPAPGTPAAFEAEQARTRLAQAEDDLRVIRAEHFATRNPELRSIGVAKVRAHTDPATFPALLSVFAFDDRDIRTVILNHLADLRNDHADATLAWAASHDREAWFRDAALKRLRERVSKVGSITTRVQWAVAAGLRSSNEKTIARAADLARQLRMFEAIPELINLQVGGGGSRAGGSAGSGAGAGSTYFVGDPGTALATLLVGTQTAFVADVQPVVGDNAVAFDPQLAVATEGTILRVIDAVVITYRVEVHNALVALADAGWNGRSTASLGWDQRKWAIWYANEFVPYRRRVEAEHPSKP